MTMIVALASLLTVAALVGYEFLPQYTYRGEHRADDRPGVDVPSLLPTQPIPKVVVD